MIIQSCIVVLLCTVITLVLVAVFDQKETKISIKSEQPSNSLLVCNASDPVSPFFTSSVAMATKHELKYFFEGDNVSKISYKYVGSFGSEQEAKDELSLMNFKYDSYMGDTQIYQEDLSPVFLVLENDATISLFLTREKFTTETAPLVFLSQENFEKLKKASIDGIKDTYEALGFTCNLDR